MEISNYDKFTTVSGEMPVIKKLGWCSPNSEMTPFVWNGRLMRLELCWQREGDRYVDVFSIIRDVKSGEVISRVADGMCFTSGYLEGDTMHVLATVGEAPTYAGDTIKIYSSKDLVSWDERILFKRDGWQFFNTALAKGDDGYVLLLEVGDSPEDDPGKTFTAYFAKSDDLVSWEMLPFDTAFPKDMYCGAPYMRYSEGYYYIFLMLPLPFRRFAYYVFRTKDFSVVEVAKHSPFLLPSADDRLISENGKRILMSDYERERFEHGFCCNNCDIDMCEFEGKTYFNYLTGNQWGTAGYMCEAEYDGPIAEFLEAFFK